MAETKLREAIEYLKTHGWTKGTAVDLQGRVCVMGARHAVICWGMTGAGDDEDEADFAVLDAVARAHYPDRVYWRGLRPAAAFNDHPDTTVDEVIAVMEKAAIQREEQA